MRSELRQRLEALHIDIDSVVAERQIDAVIRELRNPSATARSTSHGRTRVGVLLAAAVLLLFPAAAFAAEDAVPGELLYPVKRAAEWLWSAFDPTIVPEHRIEELEEVVDRSAPYDDVTDRLSDAEEAVRDQPVSDDLAERLRSARDRIAIDYPRDDGGPATPGQSSGQRDGVNTPSDRPPQPTTTTSTTEPPRREPPGTTTTSPPSQTDRPPRDGTTATTPPDDRDRPPRDAED